MGDFAGEPGVTDEGRLHEGGSLLWSVKRVFLWLAVLTVAEVAVVWLRFLPKGAIAALLLAGALAKAALVALHFMHLRIEKRFTLWMLAVAVALGAVFILGLVPALVFGPGSGAAGGEGGGGPPPPGGLGRDTGEGVHHWMPSRRITKRARSTA